jgi:hypothetical protein
MNSQQAEQGIRQQDIFSVQMYADRVMSITQVVDCYLSSS